MEVPRAPAALQVFFLLACSSRFTATSGEGACPYPGDEQPCLSQAEESMLLQVGAQSASREGARAMQVVAEALKAAEDAQKTAEAAQEAADAAERVAAATVLWASQAQPQLGQESGLEHGADAVRDTPAPSGSARPDRPQSGGGIDAAPPDSIEALKEGWQDAVRSQVASSSTVSSMSRDSRDAEGQQHHRAASLLGLQGAILGGHAAVPSSGTTPGGLSAAAPMMSYVPGYSMMGYVPGYSPVAVPGMAELNQMGASMGPVNAMGVMLRDAVPVGGAP